jgi:hypothetical protein
MKINIYINDQFYKSYPVTTETYNPKDFMIQVQADKASGLLNQFNVEKECLVRIEKTD